MRLLECVANVSEGRDESVLADLAAACGPHLLDVHADPVHNRAVFTLAGEGPELAASVRRLASATVSALDLTRHVGVHPRFGVLDVVPFVDLETPESVSAPAVAARDGFAEWAAGELALPCFLYGPLPDGTSVTLPEIRRHAFGRRSPDTGPPLPHPRAGAAAVGARPVMLAYNLWVAGLALEPAAALARSLRRPGLRVLAFDVGTATQISCNLTAPFITGPADVYAELDRRLGGTGARIERAELVGLLPAGVLAPIAPRHRARLGLSAGTTIEAGLERCGLRRPS